MVSWLRSSTQWRAEESDRVLVKPSEGFECCVLQPTISLRPCRICHHIWYVVLSVGDGCLTVLYLASSSITDFLFFVVLVHSLPVALSSAVNIYLALPNEASSILFACTMTLKSISEHSPFKSGIPLAQCVWVVGVWDFQSGTKYT